MQIAQGIDSGIRFIVFGNCLSGVWFFNFGKMLYALHYNSTQLVF